MLTSALHERLSAIPPPVSPVLLQERMLNAERKRKERLDKLVMREKAKVKRATEPNPNQPADARTTPRPFRPDHARARCHGPSFSSSPSRYSRVGIGSPAAYKTVGRHWLRPVGEVRRPPPGEHPRGA